MHERLLSIARNGLLRPRSPPGRRSGGSAAASGDRPTPDPLISIVIPAHNAASTLSRTLASVARQAWPSWEAVVVDDGSSDTTAQVAAEWARQERRIRLLSAPRGGVSVARNTGLADSKGEWVLFLDADDTLEAAHLDVMAAAVDAAPHADVVVCGWRLIWEDGTAGPARPPLDPSDPFPAMARTCPFTVHAALTRRTRLQMVGGFDPSLSTCEDWDLWQRLARLGACFVAEPRICVPYRLRAGSLSTDLPRLWQAGLEVIARGHAPDPRLSRVHPRYVSGLPAAERPAAEACFTAWIAAAAIRQDQDTTPYLDYLKDGPLLDPDPDLLANFLVDGLARDSNSLPDWPVLWPRLAGRIEHLLTVLERRATIGRLRRRTLRRLELAMSADIPADASATLGALFVVPIQADRHRADLRLPPPIERVQLRVHARGRSLGRIDVMPADGRLSRQRLDELIAREIHPEHAPLRRLRSWTRTLGRGLKRRLARLARPADEGDPCSRRFWDEIFREPDPWDYTNPYEQLKYRQTLDAIGSGRIPRALELACAEGHFTRELASRVDHLVAADISATALKRAQDRCGSSSNVEFALLNLCRDDLPGRFDLIVCSEVLYYVGDRVRLREIAFKLARGLRTGGRLVMAHANLVADDPGQPGFRWRHPFGARTIGEVFATVPDLRLVSERKSALYRIHVFQRTAPDAAPIEPERVDIPFADDVPEKVIELFDWRGRGAADIVASPDRVPILVYHRVAEDGPPTLRPYRISPADFEAQLDWLRENGFTGISLETFREAACGRMRLPKRSVMITFDDAYRDMLANALPALHERGFPATVFVVTGAAGTVASWDEVHGTPAPLLGWDEMRLMRRKGVTFAAHGASHTPFTGLSPEELLAEAQHAAETLRRELGEPCDSIAYPYGAHDEAVCRQLSGCGYVLGFTCEERHWRKGDPLMRIPRITVPGGQGLTAFAGRL
ncbi:MAG TPA: trifunctional glycosyltransferase/class I SAM-dependent methyltransferase/polysaccharide deacetylase [Geminicoccus sp.]|uniref:trifunctional glycosyltransferase/class I SAM-dependent methyltransferase/polysaccharide deacetylase n=1 Tax=Geminicoccus sp. TaxID=2024832 RepID=UPI002BE7F8A8|nr:trifunctional glycosyltransferase/class I SAM-dependent methyltransferase/polysaccharide deacetylase [Geminicoccus sp.]HWL71369.1 trifunctional glycosyltransferase/class I SAM-dependent methyltransferase/polysaccharide deacetylase [Geminicoccus sp.]